MGRLGKINLDALKKSASKLGGSFEKLYFRTQKMGVQEDVRIIPPLDNVPGGLPYLAVKIFWIKGKRYIDPATFGGKSPLLDELQKLKDEASDADLKDINTLENSKNFNRKEEILFVGYVFDFKLAEDGSVDGLWIKDTNGRELWQDEADDLRRSYKRDLRKEPGLIFENYIKDNGFVIPRDMGEVEPIDMDKLRSCVIDGIPKIIQCNVTMAKAIIDTFGKRGVVNGTDLGAMDMKEGFNLILTKTGKDLQTKYGADHHRYPMELPTDLFDHKDIPDIVALTKKGIKSDAHLRSVIRNYFMGDDIIEDGNDEKTEKKGRTRDSERSRRGSDRHNTSERDEEPKERGRSRNVDKEKNETSTQTDEVKKEVPKEVDVESSLAALQNLG